MELKPIFDRVVIKPITQKEKKYGSVIVAAESTEEPTQGEVVAVGNDMLGDGKQVEMQVKPGDRVAYSKFAGSTYKIDGEDYVVVRQTDILAVIV